MKLETNSIDYGIYIDREKAIVIALDRVIHEELINETLLENHDRDKESRNVSQQEHVQNRKAEVMKRFCKSIINVISNANHIVIFGPSTSKYELQNEIRHTKRLKNVKEEAVTADFMDRHAALRFVKDYYTVVAVGQQVFTASKTKK